MGADTSSFAFPKPRREKRAPKRIPPINRARRERQKKNEPPAALAFAKPRGRVFDTEYMLRVKELPCRIAGADERFPCRGAPRTTPTGETYWSEAIEADHSGSDAKGRKGDDTRCIPMCPGHHDDRTARRGYFRRWDNERMEAWLVEQADEVEALLNSHGARRTG